MAASGGYLEQAVLVILCFPPPRAAQSLTPEEEAHIIKRLAVTSAFLRANSSQALRVKFTRLKMHITLDKTEYQSYGPPTAQSLAANFSQGIQDLLRRQMVDSQQYAGWVMIYRPVNAPTHLINNTWTYLNYVEKTTPGFCSVPFDGGNTNALSKAIVHEYLHELDHRFKEASPADVFLRFKQANIAVGFMNPDDVKAPPGQRLAHFLEPNF
jgi:hypothetical protein